MNDHTRMKAVLKTYGLDDTFNINDYENWIPAHSYCNRGKSDTVYEGLPILKTTLDSCAKKKQLEQKLELLLDQAPKKAELLAKLQAAIDMNLTNLRELQDFVLKTNIMEAEDEELSDINKNIQARVDYQAKKMENGLIEISISQTQDVLSNLCRELGEDWVFKSFYAGRSDNEADARNRMHELSNKVDSSLNIMLIFKPHFVDKRFILEISDQERVLETLSYDLEKGVDWEKYREIVKNHYKAALKGK